MKKLLSILMLCFVFSGVTFAATTPAHNKRLACYPGGTPCTSNDQCCSHFCAGVFGINGCTTT